MGNRQLQKALNGGSQYCDMRTERRFGVSLELKDGELRDAVPGDETGVCVRTLYQGAWGLCSTNDVSPQGIAFAVERSLRLAKMMASRHKDADRSGLASVRPEKKKIIWKPRQNPHDIPIDRKHSLLIEAHKAARTVREVSTDTAYYSDSTRCIEFVSSEGHEVYSEVTRVLTGVHMVVKSGGGVLGGRAAIGGTGGFEIFSTQSISEKTIEGCRCALRTLNGAKAPSGRFPVVADPVLTGVFAHEAVGHAVEGDLVISGDSCLEGRMGEIIASENVTLIDDPTIKGAFGSIIFDDEGVRARKKILIENGRLKGYILDRNSAYRLGMVPNGGARAESYGVRPLVRMSNTVILPGDSSGTEIFEGIKFGVYALGSRGGQVDTAKGSFQFSCKEAFLIENGEVTKPLRTLALSGDIVDTLKKLECIGKDLRVAEPGFCGKGQTVPVGDGGPHIRISSATVGGG